MNSFIFSKRGIAKGKQEPILVHIPIEWVKALDGLVANKFYANRNEAIRMAIHDLIQSHSGLKFKNKEGKEQ
ncbi:MAG: ribbon-helix-helix domain-containing protein [Candidatus Nanoarchaeia archaeon]|nr:ribbon-helix-helix domain-containing protein [Candidatus Nanoarchaeia archaeon]